MDQPDLSLPVSLGTTIIAVSYDGGVILGAGGLPRLTARSPSRFSAPPLRARARTRAADHAAGSAR